MKWEEPAPRTGNHGANPGWKQIADELRQHPNEWALVIDLTDSTSRKLAKSSVQSMTSHIRRADLTAFRPPGSFEAATRENGTKLYVRYIGEVQS